MAYEVKAFLSGWYKCLISSPSIFKMCSFLFDFEPVENVVNSFDHAVQVFDFKSIHLQDVLLFV